MELADIIEKIDSLKPVSITGNRIMEIVSDPNSSLSEIVDVVKYDQGMTANLLRICNSSYFGLKKQIVSVKQAVAYLGQDKVANLAMMGNSAGNFSGVQNGYNLTAGELWRYSVSSALIAQDLAEKKHLKNMPHLFTSALLKDIGKVVLSDYITEAFEDIMARVKNDAMTFAEAEKAVIGIDHAELGARVAENWNFNPAMVFIIRHHHDPLKALPGDLSIPIIYLADCICMMMGIGGGADGLSYRYHQEIMDQLGFTDVDLQKTIADFWGKLKGIEELVNLSGGHS